MDFKFSIKLDQKLHKAAVHSPTPASISLAVRNILYRHFKTEMIDIPYIGEAQVRDFVDCGYLDLFGVKIYGEDIDTVRAVAE